MPPEPSNLVFGDPKWTDYDIEVEAKSEGTKKDSHGFGLMFRVKSLKDYHILDIGGYGSTVTEITYIKNGNKWGRVPGHSRK